jgi:DNA-binding NtrC family response regulator
MAAISVSTNGTGTPAISPAAGQAPTADNLAQQFLGNVPCFHGVIGRSPSMRQLISRMQRMAPHLTVATIEGERGSGRTLAASALHAAGPSAGEPFVPCLAIEFFTAPEAPAPLPWSAELLQKSHRGMLFLDRVHQLSAAQQETLARFLHWFDDCHFRARRPALAEEDELPPPSHLPAQLVFSTSLPLWQPNSPVGFRAEVASRLCAVRFRLPPLRERREDIPLLAQIFVQRFARACGKPVLGLGPGAIAPLLRYPWPGNVGELENVIAAAALETASQWIRPIDLPPLAAEGNQSGEQPSPGGPVTETDLNLDQAIRNHVLNVLTRTRGNKLRAAQLLGISRSTLYRILAD